MMKGIRQTDTILDEILNSVNIRLRERQAIIPLEQLKLDVGKRESKFVSSLRGSKLSIIAECKRSSPSEGKMVNEQSMISRAKNYVDNGAAAISILTEQDHFNGELKDLSEVSSCGIPCLRKDFMIDEYMVWEAAKHQADAILLLANCLEDGLLQEMCDLSHQLGLAVLLEVHNEDELQRALTMNPDCIGVNARNLRTFETDLSISERLLPQIPSDYCRVAESGMNDIRDLQRMKKAGADAVLCGTALMKNPEKLQQWNASL